jgi:uncharacterized membrane-anchored protein
MMLELIRVILLTAALIVVLLVLAGVIDVWLTDWFRQRDQRVERERAKTLKRLSALSRHQATLLNAGAHEAAKALILASFDASACSVEARPDQPRCQ